MHDDARYVTHMWSGGRSWEGKAQTWVEAEVVAGAAAADGADSLVQRYNAAVLLLEATQAQVPLPCLTCYLTEPQEPLLRVM